MEDLPSGIDNHHGIDSGNGGGGVLMNKKRAVIYARVSTKEQKTDMQVNELKKFALVRGFEVVHTYLDVVTGNVEKRIKKKVVTEYDKLMEDAGRGQFDIVLVWKYDRLARSLVHLVSSLEFFKNVGIDFISFTESIDTTTPAGEFFFHMAASFSQFERKMIAERCAAGRRTAMANGVRFGRKEQVSTGMKKGLVAGHLLGKTLRELALESGLSINTIYAILKRSISGVHCSNGGCSICSVDKSKVLRSAS